MNLSDTDSDIFYEYWKSKDWHYDGLPIWLEDYIILEVQTAFYDGLAIGKKEKGKNEF